MRILIAGASGLLGCSLVPALRARGHIVIAHGYRIGLDVSGDLTDAVVTSQIMESVQPDVVINLAALTDVDACEADPVSAQALNDEVVGNIATWVGANPHARLVQASTDHVYDGPGPCAEDVITLRNTYARSKYAGEQQALRIQGTALRINFFGRSALPGRQSFSDWLIERFSSGRDFTGFDDVCFSPLSLDTLCQAIAKVVEEPKPGVFNIGSHGGLSKAQFALTLADVLDLDTSGMRIGRLSDLALRTPRPRDMRMDSGRFEATFGMILPDLVSEIKTLGTDHAVA